MKKPVVEGNYLYELDKVTQDVVALIMDHQKNSGGGGGILPVSECSVVSLFGLENKKIMPHIF